MIHGALIGEPCRYEQRYGEQMSIEELIAEVPTQYVKIHDPYDDDQGDPKPWNAMFRAHVLRLIKGWRNETALHRFLKAKPLLVTELGFEDIPDQSTLWRAWEYRFDGLHDALRDTAEAVVEVARYYDLPAPDPDFLPHGYEEDDGDDLTDRSERIWQKAKPVVTDCFGLDRAENASIHENAFWEMQAYMSMREDMHANDGADCFAADTTRPRTPSGDTHRHHLKNLSVTEVREMLRQTSAQLVEKARAENSFEHETLASIDITKSKQPFTGQIQRDSSGKNKEPWLLGYKREGTFFQYASIKIVGHEIPLMLDMLPVHRGLERETIVKDLLETAVDLVPEIDGVLMDREFDGDGIKDICADHDVHYLNPATVRSSSEHAQQIREMEESGEPLRVIEQESLGNRPSRKLVFMPKTADDEDGQEDDVDEDVRQEMLNDMADLGLTDDSDDGDSRMFDDLLDDISDDESHAPAGADLDIVAFETDWDGLDPDASTTEQFHQVRRLLRRYRHRWGIENGFKKVKQFVVRTTSRDHCYRFFNMAFAAVLYNVWRLVDRLVQLEMHDDPDYSPEVSAALFLTIAKRFFGLGPPD